MANEFLYTRRDDAEDVIHVGETDTLVGFRSAPGIAEVLVEMKKRGGQAAVAKELSNADFDAKKCALGL